MVVEFIEGWNLHHILGEGTFGEVLISAAMCSDMIFPFVLPGEVVGKQGEWGGLCYEGGQD